MRACSQHAPRCSIRGRAAASHVSEHVGTGHAELSSLAQVLEYLPPDVHTREEYLPPSTHDSRDDEVRIPANIELGPESQALVDQKLGGQTKAQHKVLRFLQSLQRLQHRWDPTGVFEPVTHEQHTRDLRVTYGAVPRCMNGIYIRTGPNPQFEPNGGYCGVDGEAMVHAVVLVDGEATSYCNHWLRTPRFLHEKHAGHNIYPRIADLQGPIGFMVLLLTQSFPEMFPEQDEHKNYQLGNTNVAYHHGKLLALMESGLPFQVNVDPDTGHMSSAGIDDFDGQLLPGTCGHAKTCPNTGELHCFLSRLATESDDQNLLIYQVVSRDGRQVTTAPVPTSRGQLMHDFGITKNFAVFVEQALVFDPKPMFTSNTLPINLDTNAQCRVLLVQRNDPEAPPRSFDLPHSVAFLHVANAWEVGDWVHVALCRYGNQSGVMENGLDISSATAFMNDIAEVWRYSLNLVTNEVVQANLTPNCWTDFPVVPKEHVGQPTRYCYSPVNDKDLQAVTCILKTDLFAPEEEGIAGYISLGKDMAGGEPQFVARDPDAMAAKKCAYDDGFLVLYATHNQTLTSYFLIYNAATMSNEPVAEIELPSRVPVGLHGTFITAREFLLHGETQ